MEQHNKQSKDTKKNINMILTMLKGSKRYYLVGVLAAGLSALADMLDPQIIRITVDNIVGGKEGDIPAAAAMLMDRFGGAAYLKEHLYLVALALLAVAVLRSIALFLFRVFNTKGSETFVKTIRDTLFNHIEKLPYSWHMENHTGDIIQRCTSDLDTVKRFISEQMTSLIRISIMLVMSLYFMFSMNVGFALIAVIPIPLILIIVTKYRKKLSEGFTRCDEKEGYISSLVQENLTGVRVVRAFAKERSQRDNFEKHNQEYTKLWEDMGVTLATFFSMQDVLCGLQIMLVMVCGSIFCVKGIISSGEYIAFMSYNTMLSFPIRRLGRVIFEMSKAGVAIGRVAYIYNSEEEKDSPDAMDAPMDKDIEFKNVSFSYEGSKEALSNINLTIKSGTTIGILGSTGSGKSTLMLLLDKMYDLKPDQGTITVGGVDIRNIRTTHLRENISMVLQEPFMFSRSISENIGITVPGITLSDIREAARSACLDETVTSFTKGYDTFVGERGVTLSGGQKQRAAIARALTKNAPIFIFDDSLSAVDTETDAKIRTALQQRFGSATIILISHRITTLSKADKVIVMDGGRIIEEGRPEDLKNAGGVYQKIYDIQSGRKEVING